MGKIALIRFYYCSQSATLHPYPTKLSALSSPLDISGRQEGAYALAVWKLTGSSAHADRLPQHTLPLSDRTPACQGHTGPSSRQNKTCALEREALPSRLSMQTTVATPPPLLFICHATTQGGFECLESKMLWQCLWCRASLSSPAPATLCFALSSTKSCFIFLCGGFCHALKEPESDYTDE